VGFFFNAVPDWFSSENQDGNVAAVDLDNDGHLEILVCSVDHPTPGPNRGLSARCYTGVVHALPYERPRNSVGGILGTYFLR
jgi:hypothetical protein